jgi:hypothetical protein
LSISASRYGAMTAWVSLLPTTGTISRVAPNPRHSRTHCWKSRRSSHSINWKHRLKFGSTQLSRYFRPSGNILEPSRNWR